MPELKKAKLEPVRADPGNTSDGPAVDVQFNPTSLQLKLSNQTEGGRSRGRQRRQHAGTSSTVLSMELVFDSADETTGEDGAAQPVSVRQKTAMVEKFVVPKRDGSEVPPRVKFTWNELVFVGIIDSLAIDFDFFAPSGEPLRAKVRLSIKEQDARYQFLEAGPGARDTENANPPGPVDDTQPGAGTNDPVPVGGASDRSALALDGETAPEFAARQGLDPTAWRGLDADLSAGLNLEAGVEVGFSAGLKVSAGIGLAAGFQAGMGVSLQAALGLDTASGISARAGAVANVGTAAGLALSTAGGVAAAVELAKTLKNQTAAQNALAAFDAPNAKTSDSGGTTDAGTNGITAASLHRVDKVEQRRIPLKQSGSRSHSDQQMAPAAPSPPAADPRASSYGYGVPLRPKVGPITVQHQPRVCTAFREQRRRTEGLPKYRSTPSLAPWVQLPRQSSGRHLADQAMNRKRSHPCAVLYRGRSKGGSR
jgi:hypothetical protein